MGRPIKSVKDKLFTAIVEKNPNILRDYQLYKWSHISKNENKLKSWNYLLLLNIKYRLLNIQTSTANQTKSDSQKQKRAPKPYMGGAESRINKREDVQHFVKKLMHHDIVSFDILDTLVLRPFAAPTDMFYLLEVKHNYLNFANIRKQSEQEARKIKFEQCGTYEITIVDIYNQVAYHTGLDRDYCIKLEFELELEMCTSNPYMKEVYEILKANHKRMIAVSDMYLPKGLMKQILEKCGYNELEDVFMSCEFEASKRHQDLYAVVDEVLQKNGPKSVVHVGDNYVSDIEQATKFGWNAVYYRNVNVIGSEFRTINMSRMVSSGYRGIVNAHLHNGIKKYSPYYEYGFVYGGILALGFCTWIHRYCKENEIDKILFLSRDGDILRKIYNLLYNDENAVNNEYVLWSRNPGKILTSNISRFDYFRQYIDYKVGNVQTFIMEDILGSMDIGFLSSKLEAFGLKKEDTLNLENKESLKTMILENWNLVQSHYDNNRKAAKLYFEPILKGSKRAVAVDIGWQGTGVLDLKKTIENVLGFPCKVDGLMMAYSNKDTEYTTSFFMNKDINVYLWSSQHNKELFYKHRKRPQNNILMELFTTATHPSFKNFKLTDSDYEFIFDSPEVENYQIIKEVQEGMFDFSKAYLNSFNNHEMMLNISGYDAYAPFTHITDDLTFLKRFFGKYSFNRFIGGVRGNEFYNLDAVFKEFKL
ncbi:hypothetical protein [Paenibacillus sacheonensis]|uniref:Uncharacterized protein n=1 Tax=Paenibacillus sacheonensis TaxID=742054 RepID=A0A7X5C1Y1_9BACL|nr:hypothetical protein [Paenibacillus sacheonensis]MBM7567979.1 putative HAD superfamily hydrolase [Paenibacillus sacheonensis]NBC73186.1 hypothetical protein [Paenibacillus sacheonensis]